jgi:hypothetical protein
VWVLWCRLAGVCRLLRRIGESDTVTLTLGCLRGYKQDPEAEPPLLYDCSHGKKRDKRLKSSASRHSFMTKWRISHESSISTRTVP